MTGKTQIRGHTPKTVDTENSNQAKSEDGHQIVPASLKDEFQSVDITPESVNTEHNQIVLENRRTLVE